MVIVIRYINTLQHTTIDKTSNLPIHSLLEASNGSAIWNMGEHVKDHNFCGCLLLKGDAVAMQTQWLVSFRAHLPGRG